jgi:hypothetical protein
MSVVDRVMSRLSIIGWMAVAIPVTPRALHPQDSLPATAAVERRIERVDGERDAARLLSAIVRIRALDATGAVLREGAGFVVTHDGLIVTSNHLVADAVALEVRLTSGERYGDVALVASDDRRDLALVHIPAMGLATLPLDRRGEAALGEDVYVADPASQDPVRRSGFVSAKPSIDGVALLQLANLVPPAPAGFPVLNRDGEVIGVGLTTTNGIEPVSLAVPASYASALLASLGAPRGPVVSVHPNAPATSAPRAFVGVRDPSGSYALESERDWPTGQRLVGRALIIPEDASYRVLGWARVETDRSWVVTHETFYALNGKLTVLPSGRVAAQVDRTMEGGFVAPDTVLLSPSGTPLAQASGRDLIRLVGAGEDTPLSTPDGIYKVMGKGGREGAGQGNVSGTFSVVRTEAHHVSGRGNGVLLYIQIVNASGLKISFAATGSITGSGYFVLDPVRWSDGHRTTGTGSIAAGQVELTLQDTYQWEEKHLDQRITLRGAKVQP